MTEEAREISATDMQILTVVFHYSMYSRITAKRQEISRVLNSAVLDAVVNIRSKKSCPPSLK